MDRMLFANIPEFCDNMYQLSQSGNSVTAVCLFDNTVEITKWLMGYDDINVVTIDMDNKTFGGYYKEYYISLVPSAEGIDMFVEPAYSTDRDAYIYHEINVCFFDGNVSSKVVGYCTYDTSYEMTFEDQDDYDDFYIDRPIKLNSDEESIVERLVDFFFNDY